jgi:hypothetical protein
MGNSIATAADEPSESADLLGSSAEILNMPSGGEKEIAKKQWEAQVAQLPEGIRADVRELAKLEEELKTHLGSDGYSR